MEHNSVERSFREDAGRTVAALAKALGDVDRAEDAVQEAYVAALEHWGADGMPERPAAWIFSTARNRAIDRLRREQRGAEKIQALATLGVARTDVAVTDPFEIPDERLALIFACCHPSIRRDAQIALTLRTLGGLTTEEIADAFLVPLPTMAKRLVRVKQKIREAAIPIAVPARAALAERLDAVCTVIYLIFNEGYLASAGERLLRVDLCEEAVRLGLLLVDLVTDDPEVVGLLALMLYNHSRRHARVDSSGALLTLEEQDRSAWDRSMIATADALLVRAQRMGRDGPYQLQAAIASFHAAAPSAQTVDWSAIATLYTRLAALTPSPIVELNRNVAIGFVSGPAAGLAAIDAMPARRELEDYHWLHAARASFLQKLGDLPAARAAYERALELTKNDAERRYLHRRLAEI